MAGLNIVSFIRQVSGLNEWPSYLSEHLATLIMISEEQLGNDEISSMQ